MTDLVHAAPTLDLVRAHCKEILALAEKHQASNLRVFGSVARGEATADSDIDFLVDFQKGTNYFHQVELKVGLIVLLGYQVDIAEVGNLHPIIRPAALRSALPLAVDMQLSPVKIIKNDRLYLVRINESLQHLAQFTANGLGEFLESRVTRDATCQSLVEISRMAAHLSLRSRGQAQAVNWSRLIGFETAAFDFDHPVEPLTIWTLVEEDVPNLRAAIEALIATLPTDEDRPDAE